MNRLPGVFLALSFAVAACGAREAEPRIVLARGWVPRFDTEAQAIDAPRVIEHADGLEVKPGPNLCLWHPEHSVSGRFRLSVEVTHLDSGLHPHGAGIAFGGSDVFAAAQRYAYFFVRCDGYFMIKARAGDETPDVVEWTKHAAVSREDEKGFARNRLTVEARAEELLFFVNGTEVHRHKRSELPVDGQYGFRLVHDQHVKFGTPVVERLE